MKTTILAAALALGFCAPAHAISAYDRWAVEILSGQMELVPFHNPYADDSLESFFVVARPEVCGTPAEVFAGAAKHGLDMIGMPFDGIRPTTGEPVVVVTIGDEYSDAPYGEAWIARPGSDNLCLDVITQSSGGPF